MGAHLKICTKCKTLKLLELFQIRKTAADGYSNTCKACVVIATRAWQKNNPGYTKRVCQQWRIDNGDKYKASRRQPLQRLRNAVRCRVRHGISAILLNKTLPTNKILGVSFNDYIQYLSSKFVDGMTIDNYGKVWHIDHIVPLASAKSESELLALLHYTNTQPLFVKDNLSKGAKLDWRN